MPYNEALRERLKVLGLVKTSHAFQATSKASNTIDMAAYRRVLVIMQTHSTAQASTHREAVIKVLDSGHSGTMATTAIMTATLAGNQTAGQTELAILEVRSEQVGKKTTRTGTGRFIRLRGLAGTHRVSIQIMAVAGDPRYGPQSQDVTVTTS